LRHARLLAMVEDERASWRGVPHGPRRTRWPAAFSADAGRACVAAVSQQALDADAQACCSPI
jgi:hypothetical protein